MSYDWEDGNEEFKEKTSRDSYGENPFGEVQTEEMTGFDEDSEPLSKFDEPKNKKRGGIKIILGAALIFVLGLMAGIIVYNLGNFGNEDAGGVIVGQETEEEDEETTEGVTLTTVESTSASSTGSLDVSDVAEAAMPAMVAITNITVEEVQTYFSMFGRGETTTQESESCGSGIIIAQNETELLIVTNNHVVEDATTLTVAFVDDAACEAHIKGTDSDYDLAIIAVYLDDIEEDTLEQIRIAELGDSDALKIGQQVVAIGNALGYGQSVTTGIVSALNRQLSTSAAALIQTDAAIIPGNSGCALLNMDGQAIGINSSKFASETIEGMGYAIPISSVLDILEDLMTQTPREKVADEDASWLGIYGADVSSTIESMYGIPAGIYISSVIEGSPAEEAGLTAKSVITAFDGTSVSSMTDLQSLMKYYACGEEVEITLQVPEGNEYVEKTVTVTLGSAVEYQTSQESAATETTTSSESSQHTPGSSGRK